MNLRRSGPWVSCGILFACLAASAPAHAGGYMSATARHMLFLTLATTNRTVRGRTIIRGRLWAVVGDPKRKSGIEARTAGVSGSMQGNIVILWLSGLTLHGEGQFEGVFSRGRLTLAGDARGEPLVFVPASERQWTQKLARFRQTNQWWKVCVDLHRAVEEARADAARTRTRIEAGQWQLQSDAARLHEIERRQEDLRQRSAAASGDPAIATEKHAAATEPPTAAGEEARLERDAKLASAAITQDQRAIEALRIRLSRDEQTIRDGQSRLSLAVIRSSAAR